MEYESEHVEYKSQMTDDIYKAVIAFANTDGGTIYIGVDDNRNVVGIDRIDETYTRLTNGIYDAIVPDVTMFIRYTLLDNNVIKIEIGEGSYKPYYLKSKGMKPNGVYVRQGASSVQASYDQSGSIIININKTCIEFISIGGLPPGLTAEDILNGISQPRNKNLAEIFYRLRLIESYGTGLRKIYALYKNSSVQPRIEVTSNTFKLVLPNMNANIKSVDNKLLLSENPPIEITKQMQTVIDYLTEHGEMTDEDIQQLLSIKKTRAYLIVRKMNESGLIEAFGKGAFKKYKLK